MSDTVGSGIKSYLDQKLTIQHWAVIGSGAIITFDILNRTGPVMGSYAADIALMALMFGFAFINKKQDDSHAEIMNRIEKPDVPLTLEAKTKLVNDVVNQAYGRLCEAFNLEEG
jgi:hypothetical protein